MNIITSTNKLAEFCRHASQKKIITIDTEFMREKTYYSTLCLVQVATDEQAVIIDPLSKDIDLQPLYDLLKNSKVEKVFHAAKQDVEIFYFATGCIPTPLFDTQVAAMALGYGDQIGYDALVQKVLGQKIDKGARFADWSKRPLSETQLEYALGDVTYLLDVYRHLKEELTQTGRTEWIREEMLHLTSASSYDMPPEKSYTRVKSRNMSPRNLAVLQEVCAVREEEAQSENRPRRHILKDETLLDISSSQPSNGNKLARIRGIAKNIENTTVGKALLAAVKKGQEVPEEDLPVTEKHKPTTEGQQAVIDLLKALLKDCSEQSNVTPRLIANNDDLKNIACNEEPDCLAVQGWRYEIFGKRALSLKNGETALAVKDGHLIFIDLGSPV